jgi:hypothetical protein
MKKENYLKITEGLSYWEMKEELVVSVSCIGFCLREMVKETRRWSERILREINLNEIYCELIGSKLYKVQRLLLLFFEKKRML